MYLTYSKLLPMFDQRMVHLESDVPDNSKVYVGFNEGFIPLAAKYYEAMSAIVEEAPESVKAPAVAAPVAQVSGPDPVKAAVTPIAKDVAVPTPDSVPVLPAAPVVLAPVAILEEPIATPVAKKARKSSV